MEAKVEQLEEALSDWSEQPRSHSQTFVLRGMVDLLLAFSEQLSELEKQINEMATSLPEVELVKSIPGIGDRLAPRLSLKLETLGSLKKRNNLLLLLDWILGYSVRGNSRQVVQKLRSVAQRGFVVLYI